MLENGISNLKVVAIAIKTHKLFEEAHQQKMIIKQLKESSKNILNHEITEAKHRNYSKCLYQLTGRVIG